MWELVGGRNGKSFYLLSETHIGSTYLFHLKVTFKEAKKKRQNPLNFMVTYAFRDMDEEKLLK